MNDIELRKATAALIETQQQMIRELHETIKVLVTPLLQMDKDGKIKNVMMNSWDRGVYPGDYAEPNFMDRKDNKNEA